MRATERCISERFERPTGALRARTRRKMGVVRTQVRLFNRSHNAILPDRKPFVRERWPAPVDMPVSCRSQAEYVAEIKNTGSVASRLITRELIENTKTARAGMARAVLFLTRMLLVNGWLDWDFCRRHVLRGVATAE